MSLLLSRAYEARLLELACHDKSCAPPPVGVGGSKSVAGIKSGGFDGPSAHPTNRTGPASHVDIRDLSDAERFKLAKKLFETSLPGGHVSVLDEEDSYSVSDDTYFVTGRIDTKYGTHVGFFERTIYMDDKGNLVANHENLRVDPSSWDAGLGSAFNAHAVSEYRKIGVDRVEIYAGDDVGGYAWARAGFRLKDHETITQPDGTVIHVTRKDRVEGLLQGVRDKLNNLSPDILSRADHATVEKQIKAIEDANARDEDVQPIHLSTIGHDVKHWTEEDRSGREYDMWPGKFGMLGSVWPGDYYLDYSASKAVAASGWIEALACHDKSCAPPPAGVGGSLQARRGAVAGYGPTARKDVRLGAVRVTYKPDYPDDHPDPGEVVWAKVRYQENTALSKDRPVLIIGRINGSDKLAAVQLTSQIKGRSDEQLIGPGSWDRLGRNSAVKLGQIIVVDPKDYRREGSVLDRARFESVIGRLAAHHRTPVQIAASAKQLLDIEIATEDNSHVHVSGGIEFACHSKACAPPPVGVGGSTKGRVATGAESGKGDLTFKVITAWRSQAALLEEDDEETLVAAGHTHFSGGIEFACHDASCRPPTSGGTGGSLAKGEVPQAGPRAPKAAFLSRQDGGPKAGSTEFGKRINAILDGDSNIRDLSKKEIDARHAKRVAGQLAIDEDEFVRTWTVGTPKIEHSQPYRSRWEREQAEARGQTNQIAKEDAAIAEMQAALPRIKQIRSEDYVAQNESERILQKALDDRIGHDIYEPLVIRGDFGTLKLDGALKRTIAKSVVVDDAMEQSVIKVGHEVRKEIQSRIDKIDVAAVEAHHIETMAKIRAVIDEAYGGAQYAQGAIFGIHTFRTGEPSIYVTGPPGSMQLGTDHPAMQKIKAIVKESGVHSHVQDQYVTAFTNREHNKIIHDVLSEVTQLGGRLNGTPNNAKNRWGTMTSHDQVVHAVKRYPESWIDQSNVSTSLKFRQTTGRAHYRHQGNDGKSEITLDGNPLTAVHEFAHRFERTVPGVLDLEARFHDRRTAGQSEEKMGKGYGRDEVTKPDEFFERYAGKTYHGTAFELLSMGYEHLQYKKGWDRIDDDYKAFVLGTLVSAYRG